MSKLDVAANPEPAQATWIKSAISSPHRVEESCQINPIECDKVYKTFALRSIAPEHGNVSN